VRIVTAVWLRLPLVPVIVSVKLPFGVFVEVATVSLEDPEPPLIDVGVKVAVASDGSPVTLRVTVPVNPPMGETERV